ncbi:Sperm-tail PG-rich repeat-containing protein 2 [Terramyces sp. JEL0728]|nr:Sperm-tail PG-rich repeat-containing protein 2 [Terramyces sp. JEL0728]
MGYGVAVISAMVHYINPLAQTAGPGTLMCKSCPSIRYFSAIYHSAAVTSSQGPNKSSDISMYSRSERKFLAPEKDQANPNLGPGCYTSDEAVLFAGKLIGGGGYAPFSSLTPRGSYFDQIVNSGPPPGNYDVQLGVDLTHKKEGGIIFGRSKTRRFKKDTHDSPGPGAYLISSEAKSRKQEQQDKKQKKNMLNFALSQKPIVNRIGAQAIDKSISKLDEEEEYENENESVKPDRPLENGPSSRTMTIMSRDGKKINRERVRFTKANSLSWRRKYIPPSIPKGNTVYGYQENQEGELEPRKPPKTVKEDPPPYLFSFAEKSRHDNRGYGFSKHRERLCFAIYDNPAPNYYDPELGEKYLAPKTKCLNPAVMTLAPSVRITDEIISNCLKKGIPGPGSYDIKAPLTEKLNEPKNRFKLGAKLTTNPYINPELIKIPGPGAYFPEATAEKPHSRRPKPFGSTTKRFTSSDNPSKEMPAVGAYEIDEVEQPGPGAYDFINAKNPMKVQGSGNDRSQLQSRIQRLATKGPALLKLGQTQFLSSNFHVPVFGSQTTRFDEYIPGSYEISDAFDHLKNKGRVSPTGMLASHSKRDVFKGALKLKVVSQKTPAPGQYNPILPDKKPLHQKAGPFLSTEARFNECYERGPGPGSYLVEDYENSLIKKTHNVTFKEQEPTSHRSVRA